MKTAHVGAHHHWRLYASRVQVHLQLHTWDCSQRHAKRQNAATDARDRIRQREARKNIGKRTPLPSNSTLCTPSRSEHQRSTGTLETASGSRKTVLHRLRMARSLAHRAATTGGRTHDASCTNSMDDVPKDHNNRRQAPCSSHGAALIKSARDRNRIVLNFGTQVTGTIPVQLPLPHATPQCLETATLRRCCHAPAPQSHMHFSERRLQTAGAETI